MKNFLKIIEAYLLLLLIAAASLSPLAYMPFMVVLFIANGYFMMYLPRPGLRLTATILSLLLAPCALASILGSLPAAVTILPVIPFLDGNMRRYAEYRVPSASAARRRPTETTLLIGVALILSLLISIALKNAALTYACLFLITYYLILIAFVLWSCRVEPYSFSSQRVRVVAGDTAKARISIRTNSRLPLLTSLDAALDWVGIDPGGVQLIRSGADYEVTLTPPLAGPGRFPIMIRATDAWGLIQIARAIQPIELFVIPRADYAAWLARKYLEQYTVGVSAISSYMPMPERYRGMIKGVEYHSSRDYQPGDKLKDVDWKKSLKYRELIIKDYQESSNSTAIIAANLDAGDAEEADILAYNLITAALTTAVERIPTALSVYNHDGVVEVTGIENSRQILKKALNLAERISIYQSGKRYLASPDLPRLRRLISQTRNVESDSARRLTDILNAEFEALQQADSNHPASLALREVARYVSPPVVIAVLSLSAEDNEALAVALDGLRRKGYKHVFINKTRMRR